MNMIYATFNIHHNSIDVYTYARLYLEENIQMWANAGDSLELW